jgi:hypothetical protein
MVIIVRYDISQCFKAFPQQAVGKSHRKFLVNDEFIQMTITRLIRSIGRGCHSSPWDFAMKIQSRISQYFSDFVHRVRANSPYFE